MKDSTHHRKYTQKKVIQSVRRESNDFKSYKLDINNNEKANSTLKGIEKFP